MGRKAGSKNKLSADAKENVLAVFTRLGGTSRMAEWAEKNLSEFYQIYARLLPKAITGSMTVEHKIETGNAATLKERLDAALTRRSQPTVQ